MMKKNVFLLPGEMHFSTQDEQISTLLGSCVAVCLYDTVRNCGGMNHFMVPKRNEISSMSDGKCGDTAIRNLLRMAEMTGSNPRHLQAQLYGGGAVVSHLRSVANINKTSGVGNDIGMRNIEIARELLTAAHIPIKSEEVGGTNGRKIYMDSSTGTVQSRLIQKSEDNLARESQAKRLSGRKIGVLIVDDSATVRRILRAGIEQSPDMEVIGEAETPFEARERILERDPDVICLDIIMPKMDGITFLKRIMQFKPIPTVICSTIAKAGSQMEANAKAAGAVSVIDKELLNIHQGLSVIGSKLVPQLKHAAQTLVKKR